MSSRERIIIIEIAYTIIFLNRLAPSTLHIGAGVSGCNAVQSGPA